MAKRKTLLNDSATAMRQQGGKARWKGTTKAQRSAQMRAVALKRWASKA